jgi:hypothetical protein
MISSATILLITKKQVYSTTGEITDIMFYRAIDGKRSLFKEFVIPSPFISTKDIFALMDRMVVSPYRKISIRNLELQYSVFLPGKEGLEDFTR